MPCRTRALETRSAPPESPAAKLAGLADRLLVLTTQPTTVSPRAKAETKNHHMNTIPLRPVDRGRLWWARVVASPGELRDGFATDEGLDAFKPRDAGQTTKIRVYVSPRDAVDDKDSVVLYVYGKEL